MVHSITDHTNGKLNEMVEFADKNKLTDELWLTLSRFFRYLSNGNNVILAPDFAPMSLTFAVKDGERMVLNGGFIYHGPTDFEKMTAEQTYSVELNPSSKPHWSIHT
jgi:hypothetical protein